MRNIRIDELQNCLELTVHRILQSVRVADVFNSIAPELSRHYSTEKIKILEDDFGLVGFTLSDDGESIILEVEDWPVKSNLKFPPIATWKIFKYLRDKPHFVPMRLNTKGRWTGNI